MSLKHKLLTMIVGLALAAGAGEAVARWLLRPPHLTRYAAAIPGARFEVVPMAGHLPQIERLEDTRRLVEQFTAQRGEDRPPRAVRTGRDPST